MKLSFRGILLVLLACIQREPLHAEKITLYAVEDTTLFEHNPNNNLGASSTFAVGTTAGFSGPAARSRGLIKFNVTEVIPTNATISSVELTIKVLKTPSPKVDSMFDARRVFQSWGEGRKTTDIGGAAGSGEATWRARFAGSSGSVLWAAPGGATNTDFSATISASTMVRGLGSYTFASTADLVADVQTWLQDTQSNHGWILMSQAEKTARTARRVAAREQKSTNDIPRLVVEYTVPAAAQPPTLESAQRIGDRFAFSFMAAANQAYTVEFGEALPIAAWQVLTNIAPEGLSRPVNVSDGSVATQAQRIYRVRTP